MRKTLIVVCVIIVLVLALVGCSSLEPDTIVGVIVEKVAEKQFDFILSAQKEHITRNDLIIKSVDKYSKE